MSEQYTRPEIDPALDGLGLLLKTRILSVPAYQRSYSWGAEQVETFISDLRSAMAASSRSYFMGTVVLTGEATGPLTVIDGQQRLATTALLLVAVRNALKDVDDLTRADVVERDYLAVRSLRTGELQLRLSLNEEDHSIFAAIVGGAREDELRNQARTESQKRLLDAFVALDAAISKEIEDAGAAWQSRLFEWVEFLENGVQVIRVRVPNESDSFLIFETLNDRGLELTIADLLKNYLFSLAGDGIEEVKGNWSDAVAAFEIQAEEQAFTTFLRHYWSSFYLATRERGLYRAMKRRIRSSEQASEFASKLSGAAPLYAALLDPLHPMWKDLAIPQATVDSLLRFGLEQPRVLLIAAMEVMDTDELRRLIPSLVCWIARGVIVGGIGGGTTERYYAQVAVGIRDRKIRTVEDVLVGLSPIVPTDDAFMQAFSIKRMNQSGLAKYFTLALEKELQGGAKPSLIEDTEEDEYRPLQILPRRAAPDDWPAFPKDEIRQWALRIGNYVVVPKSATIPSRSRWADMRAALEEIDRPLAQWAVDFDDWGPSAVEGMQSRLAERVQSVWPMVPE